ncbi:hypothetical protein CIK05_01285 [Bdellovibrio sp. qaytius]|nr:hypothetical protein CIK05_01285 [Bdellovibrio sp. qaytius]
MLILKKFADFKNLFNSLEFNRPFSEHSSLIHKHHDFVNSKLNLFIQTDELIDLKIRLALADLPKKSFARLKASPYLCELLLICEKNSSENQLPLRRQIILALLAEIKIANPHFTHEISPKWTVDGDVVLDPKISAVVPSVKTSCGIGLNYQSYIHNTGKSGIGGYDYQMALKHKERIETAKQLVTRASSSSASLIETFTKTIQFRQNTERPNVVNSSTETSIGLIRCDNFHKIHNDLPEVVDMLVHESIHQYLHLFEEQLFDFVNLETFQKNLAEERIFPSPWSGNLLDMRSYTHAIMVWYGLIHFWSQFLQKKISHLELTNEQAKIKLNEAVYGFVQTQDVLENLGNSRKFLTEEYVSNVKDIQQKVKQMTKANNETALL